jgi:hypothetical protein
MTIPVLIYPLDAGPIIAYDLIDTSPMAVWPDESRRYTARRPAKSGDRAPDEEAIREVIPVGPHSLAR